MKESNQNQGRLGITPQSNSPKMYNLNKTLYELFIHYLGGLMSKKFLEDETGVYLGVTRHQYEKLITAKYVLKARLEYKGIIGDDTEKEKELITDINLFLSKTSIDS